MAMPKMPKKEQKRPIVLEGRERPPVKWMREWVEEAAGASAGAGGEDRKMGKRFMKAELWRGSRVKEMRVLMTSFVQVGPVGGGGLLCAGFSWTESDLR
jgi:hypothetical protein